MPSTISSLDIPHTHLDPSTPPQYLHRLIANSLRRRGVEGAEAGVLAEMERLLEHHIQALFASARDYATLSQRSTPNTLDVLSAHSSSSRGVRRLKRESKRSRRPIRLETTQASIQDGISDLRDTMTDPNFISELGVDIKPNISNGRSVDDGERLDYAFDGAPSLPPKWTFATTPSITPPEQSYQVTSASLEFVKSTVAEANVDPELGIVDYRKEGGGEGQKRKWKVSGGSIAT